MLSFRESRYAEAWFKVDEFIGSPKADRVFSNALRCFVGVDLLIANTILSPGDGLFLLGSYIAANTAIRKIGSRNINEAVVRTARNFRQTVTKIL